MEAFYVETIPWSATELATRSARDFEGFDFERVFDPLPGAREGMVE